MSARLRWWTRRRAAVAGTLLTAIAAGVLSYYALASIGSTQLGIPAPLFWLYPLAIDGMIAVGTMALVELREARRRTRAGVWLLLGSAIAISVIGNASHAGALGIRTVWSAVPACAYAGALHLLVVMYRHAPAPHARQARASREARQARARRARPREEPVRLPDGRRVSAGHARKLRARQSAMETAGAA